MRMTNIHDQMAGLEAATLKKKGDTLKRAETALAEMIDKGMAINFASVAKYAEVSKTWLYQQSDLSEQIRNCRANRDGIQRNVEFMTKVAAQQNKIEKLEVQLKQKTEEIKKLKKQLEIVYGELYKKEDSN